MRTSGDGGRFTWKWRSMVSFYLLFVGIVLLVSGVVLYVAPPGRVAHSTDWHLLGFDKDQWAAVHTLSSYISVIFSVLHVIFNWKVLICYLRNRVSRAYQLKAELVAALALTVIVFAGSAIDIPPFSTVMDFGETLKESWDTGLVTPAVPDEHDSVVPGIDAEQESSENSSSGGSSEGWGRFTVEELCIKESISVTEGLAYLADYGIDADAASRIRTLADTNGYAPSEIVAIIRGQEPGTTDAE